jgi:hypothetical protein
MHFNIHEKDGAHTKRLLDKTSQYKTSIHTASPKQNVSVPKRLL